MKTSIISLALVICVSPSMLRGQIPANLPLDEAGKITFTEVVQASGYSQDLLYHNAVDYLYALIDNSKKLTKRSLKVEGTSEIYLPMQFTVYHDFPVKSPHGLIKYDLNISLKDSRYRFIATNFTFHYLKRDRYGKFVEVNGKSKPMEAAQFKGNQKVWGNHKHTLLSKVMELTETLKTVMSIPENGHEKEIVKINDNW